MTVAWEDDRVIPEVAMIRFLKTLLSLLALPTWVIGFQSASFQSQATQGSYWVGQAPILSETYRIVVKPNYLDVELTLEFGVSGIAPAQFRDALEITGNLDLPYNSVVVGLLTWYKGRILKGKLKTKDFARKQYEEVVQRNVEIPPPRPRDPVLLERISGNRYRISIFPVDWSGTRKVRLRYLIPAENQDIDFPTAFSEKATVFLDMGAGVQQFDLVTSESVESVATSVELSPVFYNLRGLRWSGLGTGPTPLSIRPRVIDTSLGTQILSGHFHQPHLAGTMSQVILRPPSELYQDTLEWKSHNYQTFATIRSGSDSCRKSLVIMDLIGPTMDMMRTYSRTPLQPFIGWSLYRGDTLVRAIEEKAILYLDEDGLPFARAFGNAPFYPMSPTMPASLGITLGFVDSKYSLVALEEDFLDPVLESQYNPKGVPTLLPEDLFPAANENYDVPTNQWLGMRNQSKQSILNSIAYWTKVVPTMNRQPWPQALRVFVQNGILHLRLDAHAEQIDNLFVVEVLNVKGEVLKRWSKNTLASKEVTWSPKESTQGSGAFLLRLTLGGKVWTKTLLFP